jgi:Arc/MetJ-type ribon-helix-helix transcriptional regulator
LRQIDEEVLATIVRVGHIVSRSDVVKDLLREALAARAKKRSK